MINGTSSLCKVKYNAKKVPLHEIPVKLRITGNSMAETFGSWLRSQREASGMTQTELAKQARVTKTTISMYEADKIRQPRFTQLDKIAKALSIGVSDIRDAFMEHNGVSNGGTFRIGEKARIALLDQDLTPEEQQEIAEEMALAFRIVMERRKERATRNT